LPPDAAAREVLEETGLEVRIGEIVAIVLDTYADRDYTLNLYYLAEIIGGQERPADDIAELQWFSPSELPSDLAFAHTHDVLSRWKQG
jgi:ADP-ribose pyrophosphatase YjhB (NUDIX family)